MLAAPQLTSIVVDHQTGKVISADDADKVNYPASLTKMMTLYLAFEALEGGKISLKKQLQVSRHAASMPPSKLGLKPGSTITLDDAIQALAVKSANDVAVVVAEALGGSETRFAQLMTRKARALGMKRTTFMNASGLPNIKQRTTARDMVVLARRLIRDYPQYYSYFSLARFTHRGRTYANHNRLLASYAGMDGLKTGYIRASGYNLASSAVRDGRRLVAVVLGGSSSGARNRAMARILDEAFEKVRSLPLVAEAAPDLPAARPPLATREAPPPRPPVTAGGEVVVASLGPAPVSASDNPYAVQVGAFSRQDAAQRAAEAVLAKAPALLRGSDILVTRSPVRRTLYAARFVGFGRADAERVCDGLKKRRQDCLVVKMEPVEIGSD
ncbi:D-alanyl-D-alanine carboxypeptidase family protein [Geminicoccaceae bacterium 1502E]|nr:D-alanyl-D-alanine carboxypeptidase family protein [Geminicoccaceae bacterium 1502E]